MKTIKSSLICFFVFTTLIMGIIPIVNTDAAQSETIKELDTTTPRSAKTVITVDDDGPADYNNIQNAIDNAIEGDTVYVYNGIYNEIISVNKAINLTGENKETTIINGGGTASAVVGMSDWANISGFSITSGFYGIFPSSHNIITNCNIYGTSTYGIYFIFDKYTTVKNSNISSNYGHGIRLDSSPYNTIENCNITNNYGEGIHFCLQSDIHNDYINIIKCNISSNGVTIGADGIHLFYNSYNNISDNIISSNGRDGIRIWYDTDNNYIKNNIFANNVFGINILHTFETSTNNLIFHNNFINNTQNAYDEDANFWHNETLGEGNYWNDYASYDINGDGVGDDPYYISGGSNKDNYPLMAPDKQNLTVSKFKLESTINGIKISANISCSGYTDLENVYVGFFVNDLEKGNRIISLQTGETMNVFLVLGSIPVGNYTFKVRVDPNNMIIETRETDNEAGTYIELSDVAVTTEDITATVVETGIQINTTLHNPGPVMIGAPSYLYIDGEMVYYELVAVPAEGTAYLSFVWNGPSGGHIIRVVVDPDNLFTEVNKSNNIAEKTIYMVSGVADLSITPTDIYFSPEVPVEGRNTTITVICKNIGWAKSPTATITFYDNLNVFYSTTLPAIEAGNQYPVSTTFTAYDAHTIKAEIIVTEGGAEYNIGNNEASIVLSTVMPDLYIDASNISITPEKPIEGGSATITARIHNTGNGYGEGTIQFYANSILIGEVITENIQPDQYKDVSVIWNNATANSIITIKILPMYPDSHTLNNEAEILLSSTKKHNLVPMNISFTSVPVQNGSTTIGCEIWNTGTADSPNSVVSFWDGGPTTGGIIIANVFIGPIPIGASINVSATWTHALKDHTIYITIDISSQLTFKTLTSVKISDLTITSITFSEQYPVINKTILISINIENQGTATSESAELKVYADETLLDVITIPPIPANGTHTEEIPWQAQNLIKIKAYLTTSNDMGTGNNLLSQIGPETTTPPPPDDIISLPDITIWIIIGTIISGMIAGAFWIGRHLPFAFLGFKRTGAEVLESPIRSSISLTAQANPGMTKTWYSNFLSIPYSSLEEHLKLMEREGYINPVKEGNEVHIYPPQLKTPLSIEKKIIEKLGMCKGGIPQTVLARALNLSIPTLKKYGQKLHKQNMVEITQVGKETHYKLTESGQAEIKYLKAG